MRIETHNRFRDSQAVEATRVLVRDRFDEPVVVIVEPFPGRIDVLQKGDPGFAEAAAQAGAFALAELVPARLPDAPRVVI